MKFKFDINKDTHLVGVLSVVVFIVVFVVPWLVFGVFEYWDWCREVMGAN